MNAKHTPTPWKVADLNAWIEVRSNSTARPICKIWKSDDDGKDEYQELQANAKHIVHCVNVHDELIGALEQLYPYCEGDTSREIIEKALFKAKEK